MKTERLLPTIVCWLVGMVSLPCLAQNEPLPTIDEIKAVRWIAENKIRSMDLEWREQTIYAQDLYLDGSGGTPPTPVGPPSQAALVRPGGPILGNMVRKVTFAGTKVRYEMKGQSPLIGIDGAVSMTQHDETRAFDGERYRTFLPNAIDEYPAGASLQGSAYAVLNDDVLTPVKLALWLTCERRRPFDLDNFVVTGQETLEEIGNLVVAVAPQSRGEIFQRTLWLDPARDYSVVRYTRRHNEALVGQVDISYPAQPIDGMWTPSGWDFRTYSTSGKLKTTTSAKVLNREINKAVLDEVFRIQFPNGTLVKMEDENFIMRDGKASIRVTQAERTSGTRYRHWVWKPFHLSLYIALSAFCAIVVWATTYLCRTTHARKAS